ncbi:formate/nitrite transporter family protein [Halospeciosus flavus]|uniref:Formate/nitrite transporter family protein n=1 Tax=Halospeciosus flavus TaxID=3032283 RepID=A0ABD5Z643_9EURY|nr:formate/nitrite transporter family protein [Halospeciosus flavus]
MSEDTLRDYTEILERQIAEGAMTLDRPASGQFLSALSCGFDIGFGPMLLVAMGTATGAAIPGSVSKVMMSLMYTLGFVYVILGRSELFTEHTTLAVLPVLDGREPLRKLAQLWGTVYAGNIVGGVFVAAFIAYLGPVMGLVTTDMVVHVARPFVTLSPLGVFAGALLAGWLMGLLSWILTSVSDTISRVAVIVMTTFVIGFAHLPHCVAGNIEVLAAIFAGANITLVQWARFLAVTTVGNAVGGVVFVSLIKYAHVRRGVPDEVAVDIKQKPGVGVKRTSLTEDEE